MSDNVSSLPTLPQPGTLPRISQCLQQTWAFALALDRLARRSDVWLAETPEELAALQRLRLEVYCREQGDSGGTVVDGRLVVAGDDSPSALLIGCGPRTAPTGTVTVHTWDPGEVPADYARDHGLHRFEGIEALRVAHVGHLMMHRSLRGSRASLGFIIGAMEVAARASRPDVLFAHAAPGLLARYRRLGFRTFGASAFGSTRGIELPLAFVPEPGWLRRSACLWAPVVLRLVREGVLAAADRDLLQPFATPAVGDTPEALRQLWVRSGDHALAGLGPTLAGLVLERSVALSVGPGVPLKVEGFVSGDLQLLVGGEVQVEQAGRVLGRCGPGALIGLAAWAEGHGRQSLTVRAIRPTTLINVRGGSLRRLLQRDPGLAEEWAAAVGGRAVLATWAGALSRPQAARGTPARTCG